VSDDSTTLQKVNGLLQKVKKHNKYGIDPLYFKNYRGPTGPPTDLRPWSIYTNTRLAHHDTHDNVVRQIT